MFFSNRRMFCPDVWSSLRGPRVPISNYYFPQYSLVCSEANAKTVSPSYKALRRGTISWRRDHRVIGTTRCGSPWSLWTTGWRFWSRRNRLRVKLVLRGHWSRWSLDVLKFQTEYLNFQCSSLALQRSTSNVRILTKRCSFSLLLHVHKTNKSFFFFFKFSYM